jgi:hypothetical protein
MSMIFTPTYSSAQNGQVYQADCAHVSNRMETDISLRLSPSLPRSNSMDGAPRTCCDSASHHGAETEFLCSFDCAGPSGGLVWVSSAPQKMIGRMREKLVEYREEGAQWPLTACILDPVRASVVCDGPAQMMEVICWILEAAADGSGMPVCRIKNKFSLGKEQLVRVAALDAVLSPHSCMPMSCICTSSVNKGV